MMDQLSMPCAGMSPALMLVHIVTSAITTVLVAFLTQRRVRKDRVDGERWLQLNGGRSPSADRPAKRPTLHKGEH